MLIRRRRKKAGGAIVEVIAGLFVLIPVVLFIVDIVAMVLAQMAHDALAKDCARAAAEETNAGNATAAVNQVISGFSSPVMVIQPGPVVDYNGTIPETVRVQTTAIFTFPVQVPFCGNLQQTFVAEAREPIVGVLPN